MIKIHYTQYFDDFLNEFNTTTQDLIKKIITDYCDNKILLPRPKSSSLKKEIQKVALPDVGIVIFYLDLDDVWLILNGVKMFDRVA